VSCLTPLPSSLCCDTPVLVTSLPPQWRASRSGTSESSSPKSRRAHPPNPSALRRALPPFRVLRLLRPLLTSRCASSGRRPFRREARSPQVRTRSFTAQPPHLRRLAFDHKSFAVDSLLALVGAASYPVLVHRLTVYAPRFLPTLGHPHAVALHLPRCGQLGRGLTPRRSRPCWAHCPPAPRPRRARSIPPLPSSGGHPTPSAKERHCLQR